MKKGKSSSLPAFLLIVSGACLILFSAAPALKEFIHYKNQETFYNTLTAASFPAKRPYKNFHTLITSSYTLTASKLPQPSEAATPSSIQDKYTDLLKANPEVIGWISISDTPINYPLVQHNDNQYYLKYDSSNSPSIYGSIYVDYRDKSDLDNQNTLIYGHNMNNGSMFHSLVNFKKQDFFEKHPYIYVSNLYDDFTYEVFAVYVVDANTERISVNYEDDAAFLDYLQDCKSRSLFMRPVSLAADDKIITLVTCSYELDNARTIVQAKRILQK